MIVYIGGKNVVFIHIKVQTFTEVEFYLGKNDGKYVDSERHQSQSFTTGNFQLRASLK